MKDWHGKYGRKISVTHSENYEVKAHYNHAKKEEEHFK